ncbi:MAG: winged helix-turn-helix transcriptional regulator [Candidatus Hodarchaeota archaeon]
MDTIDRKLLWELHENCRASYKTLSSVLGISANAVKKRVAKLIDTGVIFNYTIMFSLDMLSSEVLYGLVHTDGEEKAQDFINQLGANPMIHVVGSIASLTGGAYIISAQYIGAPGLLELGRFIRTLDHVSEVELFPLLIPQDHADAQAFPIRSTRREGEFTKTELKVLQCLLEDARMSISDIANLTGLTARRVGRTIQQLMNRGVMFSVRWNLSAGGLDVVIIRIRVDELQKSISEVSGWLRSEFPDEFWLPYISADEPLVFAIFVVQNMQIAEKIARTIKEAPFVKSIAVSVQFSETKFPWLGELKIREMIHNAGLTD